MEASATGRGLLIRVALATDNRHASQPDTSGRRQVTMHGPRAQEPPSWRSHDSIRVVDCYGAPLDPPPLTRWLELLIIMNRHADRGAFRIHSPEVSRLVGSRSSACDMDKCQELSRPARRSNSRTRS